MFDASSYAKLDDASIVESWFLSIFTRKSSYAFSAS